MMYGYEMTGGFGGFFMILWWVLIIVGIVLLVKWLATSSSPASRIAGGGDALELLKQRYARGEIEKEEFEQKKRDLSA